MSIHKIGSDLIRPFGPKGGRDAGAAKERDDGAGAARPERADRIEISAEGRSLAARMLGAELAPAGDLDEVAARIRAGFYDDPAVLDEVARRLLESGDLDFER